MSKRGDLSDDTASQSHRTAESATYGSDPKLDAYILCSLLESVIHSSRGQ